MKPLLGDIVGSPPAGGPRNDLTRLRVRGILHFSMPNTPVLKNEKLAVYLSGYTDGEGSFCISFSPRRKLKAKIEIRPSFSVSQNSNRAEVLELFKQYFGCGTIRPDRSDKTYKYEIRSLDNLVAKIIPHFKRYPLLSSKQKDFEIFTKVCEWMFNKNVEMRKVIDLAYQMNPSGKRKFSKDYLFTLL